MMRHLYIFLLVFVSSTEAWSQIRFREDRSHDNDICRMQELDTLDVDHTECIYQYSITDSTLHQTKTRYDILQIGRQVSVMKPYDDFRQDSTFLTMDYRNIHVWEFDSISAMYPLCHGASIYKNFAKGELTEEAYFSFNYNTYTEEMPEMQWTLCEDTTTVCGYLCHKATACFRGRRWTAWYCDLPIDDGPWKLHGLPGLILWAEDASRHHVFKAVSIRKAKAVILRHKTYPYKTNRKRYISIQNDCYTNPALPEGVVAYDAYGNVAKPASYRFHNVIEME